MDKKPAKYSVVKESIKRQIEDGTLKVDDKLPTETEYAQLYDVSSITIRRALTELAEEGYIKRLKHKGTFVTSPAGASAAGQLIALILYSENHNDSSIIHIIKGAQTMTSSFNYSLIVEWNNGDPAQEAESIRKMLDLNVKGFIIYSFNPEKSISSYRYLDERNIPFVLIDRYDVNYSCYFSGCNNYNGGALATQFLLDQRHQNIKFAGHQFFLRSEQERYDGFCSAMRKAGYETTKDSLILNADYDKLAEQIRARKITAIFCCNDILALHMMRTFRELGLRIPEDVSIMGFDDWIQSPDVARELTTVRQDFHEIGSNAAFLLLSTVQKKLTQTPVKLLADVSLVVRTSVCENLF